MCKELVRPAASVCAEIEFIQIRLQMRSIQSEIGFLKMNDFALAIKI